MKSPARPIKAAMAGATSTNRTAATPLELLAPAGNAEIGMAAIDHGADAVYVGAPGFSARADAGVSLDDIARLIQHAHLYYARVYVALNTILTDPELPEALEIVGEVFRLGADGLILQDVGLLEQDLPPIPLIASTQMHNDTPEKVRFLEEVGFKRVILARELSTDEIRAIRKISHLELEAFVHGALCVSYSGQCYMSQATAGRSGNRGVCAQPCRHRYTLTDARGRVLEREKFLLSLKDLNRMDAIPDLVAAGVTSFKIEGRYKGMDYVKNVTAAYRLAIDRFIGGHSGFRKSSSGASTLTFSPDPDKTFNRGYTPYLISGRKEKIGSPDTQKSTGPYVGKVIAVEGDFFRLTGYDLANGDGLCFFSDRGELEGFRVDRVDRAKIHPNSMKGIKVGTSLFRNHNAALARMLNKPSARRTIGVKMEFLRADTTVHLVAADEDGNRAEIAADVPFEPSHDPGCAREQIEKQLIRTGNTPYRLTALTTKPAEPGFLPVATLNGLRRQVLERLSGARQENYPRETIPFQKNDAPYPAENLDFRANVLNEHARQFYERHGAKVTERAFETLSRTTGRTVMTTRYCIRHQLDLCPKYGGSARSIEEPLKIRDGQRSYRLEFDCRQCRMLVILEEK
jgi:23S rRNA 5-hydroxycytidine C2501 synthase